jgi:hypothetical protein
MDLSSALFIVPTIPNDLPPLEPVVGEPDEAGIVLHEDEWSQVELFPKGQLASAQKILNAYKPFEAAHRAAAGWRQVYVREIDRTAVIPGRDAVARLEAILGTKVGPAPLLYSPGSIPERVMHGFSLPLGGGAALYGYATPAGIPVLGALIGDDDSGHAKLREAFVKLHAAAGLVLVDWRGQFVLQSADANGQLDVWRP